MTDLRCCFCNASSGVKSPGTQDCLQLRQRWSHIQGLMESQSLKISHFLPLQAILTCRWIQFTTTTEEFPQSSYFGHISTPDSQKEQGHVSGRDAEEQLTAPRSTQSLHWKSIYSDHLLWQWPVVTYWQTAQSILSGKLKKVCSVTGCKVSAHST